MSINFALLGAGRIGSTHAEAIANNIDANLYAVYDPFDNAAQVIVERYNCAKMELDAIINSSDIDAVAICTPTNTHADLIEKFARAGKAIFCEKPIDLSLERVQNCLQTVKETNAKLMIGFNRRFDPHFKNVQSRIQNGEIGTVEQVVITSRDPGLPPFEYIEVSGGIFRDMTIHDFDMARFLLGEEITSVYATGSVLVDSKVTAYNDFDSAMIIMRTASGKLAHINNSRRATYGYDQRIEVHGSKGMIRATNPRPITSEIANEHGYSREALHDFFMTRYLDAYANEIAAFIEALNSNDAMNPSGFDGLAALALAQAALKSASSGKECAVECHEPL